MDKWEAPDETSFWLSEGTTSDSVAQARVEINDGQGLTEEQIRAEFGQANHSL